MADDPSPSTSRQTSSRKPLPAIKVFSSSALPLHLPHLDAILSARRFRRPRFSRSEPICSSEERELFELNEIPRGGGGQGGKSCRLHIGGRQLKIVANVGRSTSVLDAVTLLHRRNGFRAVPNKDQDDEQEQDRKKSVKYPPQVVSAASCEPTLTGSGMDEKVFPPLMLLKTTTLSELKSNAVGPRKPPGGILGSLPGMNSILSTVIDLIIGVEGSSTAASIINLSLFIDFAQIMRNNLEFQQQDAARQGSTVHRLLTVTLPSILALDFVSVFGLAVIFWFLWIAVVTLSLAWYLKMTSAYDPNTDVQGFEGQPYIFRSPRRRSKLASIFVTFLLTAFYLPLSKLCIDALVWGSDFWPTGGAPTLSADTPLLRATDDVCYTTTMHKDEFNWAWIIIPISSAVLILYTALWPLHLRRVIRNMSPKISEFNELGIKRTKYEIDIAYKRMLDFDKSPLVYLYNDFRISYATYKPLYLIFFKLTTLSTIAIFTSRNCLWKEVDPQKMLMAQQGILIGLQVILLGVHLLTRPFIDSTSNRSERCSRITYVLTATVGLLVAARVRGQDVLRTGIVYTIQAFSYGANIYFALINKNITAHLVKRLSNRLDFSIDIHNPALHVEKHVKRRVWQETLSIILLSGEEYRMPLEGIVTFSRGEDWPPYLLFFQGTVAERHVENLKIVKDIGLEEYSRQVQRMRSLEGKALREAMDEIQLQYTGPDAYYRPTRPPFPEGVTTFFGKAFLIPFPPTLVIRYDQGRNRKVILTSLDEFQSFLRQNRTAEVEERRAARITLRALDGQIVFCPYVAKETTERLHRGSSLCSGRKGRKTFSVPTVYTEGVLRVKVQDFPSWESYNFSAGFDVEVIFSYGRRMDAAGETWVQKKVIVPASEAFGLDEHCCVSGPVVDFFSQNQSLITSRRPGMVMLLQRYRRKFHDEAKRKEAVLKYSFLIDVFERSDLSGDELRRAFRNTSELDAIRTLPQRFPGTLTLLYERLALLGKSRVHAFWWLWWDDLYRTNSNDYKMLRTHSATFDSRSPTSIAYRPMPREKLEKLLLEKGVWREEGTKGFLNRGQINRLYFSLNRIVFDNACAQGEGNTRARGGKKGVSTSRDKRCGYRIEVGQGSSSSLIAPHDASHLEESQSVKQSDDRWPGSGFTGGGAEEGDPNGIPDRPAYRWEQRLNGRPQTTFVGRMRDRCLQALSLRPYAINPHLEGLWVYVEEKNGRLVLQNA